MMTGKQMRDLRDRKVLTQEELAAELGLSRELIVAYERGSKRGQPFAIPRLVALACAAIEHDLIEYAEDPDALELDIYRLCTVRGVRSDVIEWSVENLEKAVVFHGGKARFANVNDCLHFKMEWAGELERKSR